MKRKSSRLAHVCFALTLTTLLAAHANNQPPPALVGSSQRDDPTVAAIPASQSAPIPMDQLGAVAGKQYQGDGLSVIATPDGASLRCAFQRLEGQVTREGLWLSSTSDNNSGERFRVRAASVGRTDDFGFGELFPLNYVAADVRRLKLPDAETQTPDLFRASLRRLLQFDAALPPTGLVSVTDNVARFIRPGLTEEYTVSVDGVRQDFIIEQRPAGDGELRVELDVTGAKAEPLVNGARLVLEGSGRKLAYNRLRVTDATGRELPARMEVTGSARVSRAVSGVAHETSSNHSSVLAAAAINVEWDFRRDAGNNTPEACAPRLAVLVDDAAAIYPVRIDPTFSDADWISVVGPDSAVLTSAVDTLGNLYIGGAFTVVGGTVANRIAKWNGSSWSALGAGMDSAVNTLAVSDGNIYAGGDFSTAGGVSATRIAKWNGSTWSALGAGLGGFPLPLVRVYALAVSSNEVYAGGYFTTAGSGAANNIAKWDGNTWISLGTGLGGNLNSFVYALTMSGNEVYAGGGFTTASGSPANYIAKWNGSSWSAMGAGMNQPVYALAVSGNDLYAGGAFTTAGGNWVYNIAKWNGSNWSALGTGMNGSVKALAVSAGDLYAAGEFTTAGATTANYIAKWNGSSWSAMGSGMNATVYTLTSFGSYLYAAGAFTTAGNKVSAYIAKANISGLPFPGRFTDLLYSTVTGFSCTFLEATVGQPYRIQTSTSLAAGSWTDYTNFTYTAPIVITVPVAGNTNRFFRAITP